MSIRKSLFLLLLMLTLPLLLSCRSEPLAPEEPIVILLSPGDGSTLVSGDVQVRIYLQNFSMVENTGQPNKASEGHVIYYLDVNAPRKYGDPATTSPGTFVATADTSYIWPNVSAGPHTFTVQLVNNDDTPLLAPVAVRANVNVTSK
jgi:hypothetical protein